MRFVLTNKVLSQFNDATSVTKEIDASLLVENVFVLNAFYETMSKSFQPTANKSSKRLSLIRLTPILSECSKPEDTYKYVPLIDDETGETICMVCFKFWHSNNSSLQGTLSQSLNDQRGDTPSMLAQIPVYNPIYFYVFNATQNFLKAMEQKLAIH